MDTRLLRPWDLLGKSTGMGCHFLLHGIFLTQGSNPGLLHCRQMLYHLSHKGSPCIGRYFSQDWWKSSTDEVFLLTVMSNHCRLTCMLVKLELGFSFSFESFISVFTHKVTEILSCLKIYLLKKLINKDIFTFLT